MEDIYAIIVRDTVPDPWSTLRQFVAQYRTDGGYQSFNMLELLTQHDLFQVVGERELGPLHFQQSIDDYIASYHSRSGFSRERMGPARAAAFDEDARHFLHEKHSDGMLSLQVVASIVWGLPHG